MTKLAVCMPVYNAGDFLDRAIRSILDQSFADFDFYICDDKSTDNSADIVSSFDDERIIFLRNRKNMGPATTRNRMTKEVYKKGHEYMALMDADDVCDTDRLKVQVAHLDENQALAICGTAINIGCSGGIWEVPKTPALAKVACIFNNPFPTPTLMFRVEPLKKTKEMYKPSMVPCADYAFLAELMIKHNLPGVGINLPMGTYTYNANGVSHQDCRVGQIKKDKEIKANILKYLNIQVPTGWVSSFHDLCFYNDDASEDDFVSFCKVASLLYARNELQNVFARSYLRDSLAHRIKRYQERTLFTIEGIEEASLDGKIVDGRKLRGLMQFALKNIAGQI